MEQRIFNNPRIVVDDTKVPKANNDGAEKEYSFHLQCTDISLSCRVDNETLHRSNGCNASTRMGSEKGAPRSIHFNLVSPLTHNSISRRRKYSSGKSWGPNLLILLVSVLNTNAANINADRTVLQEQQRERTRLKRNQNLTPYGPDGWETFSMEQIYQYFKCDARKYDTFKPVTSLSDWQFLRSVFEKEVGGSPAFDDPVPPTLGYTLDDEGPPPFYAKHSEGKGRGLFASRDIQQGEVVHDGTHSDVIFPDAMAYRRFIFSLTTELACDTTYWNWTQRDENDNLKHFLGPNISSFMNQGKLPNTLPESETSSQMRATRDIAKDEEILTDYNVYETNWEAVGL